MAPAPPPKGPPAVPGGPKPPNEPPAPAMGAFAKPRHHAPALLIDLFVSTTPQP